MILKWSPTASADLVRLREFLASNAPAAAERLGHNLARAPRRLLSFPRLGVRLPAYAPREVRRLIVGHYEMRYEIIGTTIWVMRIWHEREHRTATDD